MNKITAKDVKIGTKMKCINTFFGRKTPYIDIGKTIEIDILKNTEITIIEKPKNYEGCGRCVKYTIENDSNVYYTFWIEFKKNTEKI